AGTDLLTAAFTSPQAAPLVGQRQSRIPSQQVIVPGGFQHQLYSNQFSNLPGLDSRNARLAQAPVSIQNQQFAFLPRGDPFSRSPSGRAASSSLASSKPTSSRSLSPNFVEIVAPNPQRLVSGGRGSGSSSGQIQAATSSTNQQISGNARNAEVQYDYYDETDGDVLYQYGNDFNEPGSLSSSSLNGNRHNGQYFAEVSQSKGLTDRAKNAANASQRNPTSQQLPTTASTSSKRDQSRYGSSAPSASPSTSAAGSSKVATKATLPTGSNRLFRPSRPASLSSSASSSSQASRETSSSFIPLIDESEEPEQGLALNGRSVQSTSHRGNSLTGVRPPLSLLRSTTTSPPSAPDSNSSQKPSAPEKPVLRSRGQYTRSQASNTSKSSERNSSASSSPLERGVRRPSILRGGNNNNSSGNRLTATSRPPIIIRPRNLTRSRQNKVRDDPITASSTYRPDPNFDQTGSSSSENPKLPSSSSSNSLPSAEDYTVEYVEYPFHNEDNSSVVEYYEVSEETAQALLQRAKAKVGHRKPTSVVEPSPKPNSNESATKVTVSVSSKSSFSSTTTSTSTSTSTTPAPETSSSEENVSDQIDPSGEVVVSVATTKSVSGKGKGEVTEAPLSITTVTPRVTFSRATGSSFVVASVQTSRSVGKGPENRVSKTIQTEGLKDNMPSGAETAPEYYEEEYTYPDNYPILNNDAGSLLRPNNEHEEEADVTHEHYNPHEYSHEVSLQPPAITPTRSVIPSSEFSNGVLPQEIKESSEASTSAVVRNGSDESYDEETGSHAPQPRKLPSKKGDNIPSHIKTLVDDVSELEVDHPLRPVNQADLAPPPDDEASYHVALNPSTLIPTLTTTTVVTTTTTPPPQITTTTEKPKKDPTSIFSSIRFAEVSPDFLPPGFKLPPPPSSSPEESIVASSEATTPTTTTTSTTTTTEAAPTEKALGIQFAEVDISSLLPKGYKPRPSLPKLFTTSPTSTTTTTEKPVEPSTVKTLDPLEALKSIVQFKEIAIPGLVPKDYKPPTEDTNKTASPVLPGGIRFETPSNLFPPGYKPPASEPVVPIKFEVPSGLLPKGYKPPSSSSDPAGSIKFEVPANLLPPGYKPPGSSAIGAINTTAATPKDEGTTSTKKPGGLVFPTKPGGSRITRPTTTEAPKGDTPLPPSVRIATEASTTTKATTTTTTPPPKRSPPGLCPQGICRMEATIRLVGGVKWVPEFQDINTDEYKHLETTVKREEGIANFGFTFSLQLDGAYRSSGLAPWYRKVEIEGFNRGSVIVDYFLLLDGIDRDLTSDFVVRQFHKSLLDSADELPYYDESEAPDQLVSNGRLRFGRYTIDPRYTDFKVVNITKDSGPLAQEPLIPQWGIAVIVIGLASLLFVIIFGVTVLVNRHKNSKKKNAVSLTQEMLSEFNKSHMGSGAGGLDNYGADDLYNMDDVWNDKQMDKTFDRKPTKRSQGSGKGSANYNIYDSWKTEWNGYYYNGNYYGDSGYAPSRRRSDYDTNF
ncbi:hypothetical protein Ocin01_05695, partial [Orchesella cincta]